MTATFAPLLLAVFLQVPESVAAQETSIALDGRSIAGNSEISREAVEGGLEGEADGGDADGEVDGGDADGEDAEWGDLLTQAVSDGDLTTVSSLLKAIPAQVELSRQELLDLMLASFALEAPDPVATAAVLLAAGARLNAADVVGYTVLHRAAAQGAAELVAWLLRRGAVAGARDEDGETALHLAVRQNHLDVVRELVRGGADLNPPAGDVAPIHLAFTRGHRDMVALLRDLGASEEGLGELRARAQAEATGDVNAQDEVGYTRLTRAALHDEPATVRALLEAGANPEIATDETGWTPLLLAADRGHADIVAVLLRWGVEVDRRTRADGWTALARAAVGGHAAVVRMLLAHHADRNRATDSGTTPLTWALRGNHEEVVRLLREAGARE